MYDYLVVGAGLFGAVFTREMLNAGKRVLVVEKRDHIGGNVYTYDLGGIPVHRYGPHIFHTKMKNVWDYICQYAEMNRFTNAPLANYNGEYYHLPFNMNTFMEMWGVKKPDEAKAIIRRQREEVDYEPINLEEQAISMVGRDIYEKLIKGYTEKQWGRECKELPKEIIKRLPVRFTFDNSYFSDVYQGIPVGGYTRIVEKLLDGADVLLDVDYKEIKNENYAKRIVYTGPIDEYFDYCFGPLEYRSLDFVIKDLNGVDNYQGNAVVNYTGAEPYTRIVEHKHFAYDQNDVMNQKHTVVSYEYPSKWELGKEAYYPINDKKNNELYAKYSEKAGEEKSVVFGGRMGEYRYLDMDVTIARALDMAKKELQILRF